MVPLPPEHIELLMCLRECSGSFRGACFGGVLAVSAKLLRHLVKTWSRLKQFRSRSRSRSLATCLPASLRALAVSSSTRVHRSLVHRWFQGWGVGQIVAMRQASLRATAPMMTILLHPPGSEGGCPIKWTVRRPAGKPGSPPHATADQRDEVHVLLPDLIDDLGQASGQGHAGDLHALALLHGPEPGA